MQENFVNIPYEAGKLMRQNTINSIPNYQGTQILPNQPLIPTPNNLQRHFYHNCYKFGHSFQIIEHGINIYSICRHCGKIGEKKIKC